MIGLGLTYVMLFLLAGAAGFAAGWFLRRAALQEQAVMLEADTMAFRTARDQEDSTP